MRFYFLLFSVILLSACVRPDSEKNTSERHWLDGNESLSKDAVDRQFGGFGRTMMEVGYRYREMYWGAEAQNWDYVLHQLEEIEECIELGVERKPNRKASADIFLENAIKQAEAAAQKQDSVLFMQAFERLTNECNACHIREDHAFVKITYPSVRTSILDRN